MPRSRPWSASRSSWGSRGGGRSFASAAIAIAIAYAVALAYIAAVACIVAAPGLLMAGAAGAVAAADAEVAAYSAVVAYVVVEKRGPAAPPLFFSYAWMRSLPKSARVRVYLDDVRYERSINCNERMYISICRVPIPPPGCVRALIAVCSHALAHFLAASASDPVRNVPV